MEVLCLAHTVSPLVYGCKHVADAVRTKSPVPAHRAIPVRVEGKPCPYYLCEVCERGELMPSAHDLSCFGSEELKSLFSYWPICARCIDSIPK